MMMNLEQCVEEVELALDDLVEENMSVAVIVEGKKDKQALQTLGLTGCIITINKGKSLSDFADEVIMHHQKVIILSDWDRRGGSLCRRLKELFKGRIDFDVEIRQRLSKFAMIKKVEGIPSWLETVYIRMDESKVNHDSSSKKNNSSIDI